LFRRVSKAARVWGEDLTEKVVWHVYGTPLLPRACGEIIIHAVNDLGFVSECLAAFGQDFKIFVGLEELSSPMMAVDACGLMNVVGNLCPGVLREMCEAVWKNDMSAAQSLHQQLFEINQAVFFDTNPIPIKYMMKRLGILPTNEHRLPMVPATPELEKRLEGVLRCAGLLVADKAA
jgi:4-hydroxy-tetrahydrodipicolinate synthase